MAEQHLFLSYKRGAAMTPVVKRLNDRIQVELSSFPVRSFFDRKSIDAGEEWEAQIDAFLGKATLFVAFISIDFWLSAQCRRELDIALARYRVSPEPRKPTLLFILADALHPGNLAFDETAGRQKADDEAVRSAKERVDEIKSVGDFNFLGPYAPGSGALTRLVVEDFDQYDLQLAAMVQTIRALKAMR
jgi:hypothetical protein